MGGGYKLGVIGRPSPPKRSTRPSISNTSPRNRYVFASDASGVGSSIAILNSILKSRIRSTPRTDHCHSNHRLPHPPLPVRTSFLMADRCTRRSTTTRRRTSSCITSRPAPSATAAGRWPRGIKKGAFDENDLFFRGEGFGWRMRYLDNG